MWVRLISVVLLSAIVTGIFSPVNQWTIYLIVLGAIALVYWLDHSQLVTNLLKRTPAPSKQDAKVVSLEEYRKKKDKVAPNGRKRTERRFAIAFETTFVTEADLLASMLEQHGIETQVINRQNATILIHPMGELTVKVLVPREKYEEARALIEHFHAQDTNTNGTDHTPHN